MTRKNVTALFFLAFFFIAPTAFAETIELVTYYPAPGGGAGIGQDMHITSLTVGDAYRNIDPMTPGVALFETGVGIGAGFNAVDPNNLLQVASAAAGQGISLTGTGPGLTLFDGMNSRGGLGVATVAGNYGVGTQPGDISLFSQVGNLRFGTTAVPNGNPTIRMTIATAGNVGIGTLAPAASALLELSSTTQGFLPPRMSAANRAAIAAPAVGLQVYDTNSNVLLFWNGVRWQEVGGPPIGTIQAWHKTYPNTPALPWGWKECDGTPVADAGSPYNGQAVPNLNRDGQDGGSATSGLFLRGCSGTGGNTTGRMFDDMTAPNGLTVTGIQEWNYSPGFIANMSPSPYPRGATPYIINVPPVYPIGGGGAETHPPNMTVVWIIRIK